jgi:hypothetical protein
MAQQRSRMAQDAMVENRRSTWANRVDKAPKGWNFVPLGSYLLKRSQNAGAGMKNGHLGQPLRHLQPFYLLLTNGACSLQFIPNDGWSGTMPIYVAYSGDSTHYTSSGKTLVYVTPNDN